MTDILKELMGSKKFLAMIAGAITVLVVRIAGKAGLALDADSAKQVADAITALAVAFIVGQGVADHGKEAAKITANAPTTLAVDPKTAVLDLNPKTGASS